MVPLKTEWLSPSKGSSREKKVKWQIVLAHRASWRKGSGGVSQGLEAFSSLQLVALEYGRKPCVWVTPSPPNPAMH